MPAIKEFFFVTQFPDSADSPDSPDRVPHPPRDLPSTHAGGQDDVSSRQTPSNNIRPSNMTFSMVHRVGGWLVGWLDNKISYKLNFPLFEHVDVLSRRHLDVVLSELFFSFFFFCGGGGGGCWFLLNRGDM